MMEPIPTIRWVGDGIRLLDQRRLPRREAYLDLLKPRDLIRAIRSLAIRGAPALGIAGAYGVALAAAEAIRAGKDPRRACALQAPRLAGARPTAVNLSLGVREAMAVLSSLPRSDRTGFDLVERLKEVGDRMLAEDLAASRSMARHGVPLVPEGRPVLTHCNTGGLATGGLGTALAVAASAAMMGRIPEVLVDETRPWLQGGRLTLWELSRTGIPSRLLCDAAAPWAIRSLDVGCVLVGADRVAANGDTANKIGTMMLALAARSSGVSFFVVAPRSSFDPLTPTGAGIRVEERGAAEVLAASGWRKGDPVGAYNPAFDVTPADLITAWITDRGVERPPFSAEPADPALRPS